MSTLTTQVHPRLGLHFGSFFFFPRACGALMAGAFAALVLFGAIPAANAETQTLPTVREPGAILKIIHGWPDQPQDQDRLITDLIRQGFSGVVCNVSFKKYLESEELWNAFERAVGRARQSGMELWLYDESGYPSGTAGHLVLQSHPEWEAEGLLTTWEVTDGQQISLSLPPGSLVLAAAYPWRDEGLDLAGKVDTTAFVNDGKLTWKPEKGRWILLAITRDHLYPGTHAELNLAEKRPYLNLLSPEPTARFLEVTHQQYANHLGTNFAKSFVSTFTDEPSLMSLFLKPMPYRPLPWSPGFSAAFQARRGYAIEPLLPLLLVDGGAKTGRTRYDFWKTVGELVAENYCGQILNWCRQHHLRSGGHLLMEEGLTAQVGLYGDFFSCLRQLDAPGIDCLTSIPAEVPWQIARQAASAAHLDGNTEVMCETSDHSQRYRPEGDKRPIRRVTEAEIRGTCNKLIVSGVNKITSYYSFDGIDDHALGRINHWVAQVCSGMKGGYQAADIALLYPVDSLWPRFVPSRHWASEAVEAQRIENSYHSTAQSLFDHAMDFTIVDSKTLTEATLEKDALCHGKLRWRVLVLPQADTLPAAAWKKLAQWVEQGGVVVALGCLPANSESEFPSSLALSLTNLVFQASPADMTVRTNSAGGAGVFLPQNMEWFLPKVIGALLQPDITFTPSTSSLRYTHIRMKDCDRMFVVNDDAQPWTGTISIRSASDVTVIRPDTGVRSRIAQGNAISLKLDAYDGALLEFSPLANSPRKSWATNGLAHLSAGRLPTTVPVIGRGEFVREKFGPDSAHSQPGQSAWNARANLTKSQVDVHLFASFHYSTPQDLAKAAALAFDTWVPAQRAASQLLLIVHEKDGGDFFTSTGRSLAKAGYERIVVPLSSFQLAGWSTDNDGHLDWAKVTDIRIGWGGYFGTEGETVDFSFSEPQTVVMH